MKTAPNAPKTPDAQLVCANSMLSLVIVIGTVVVRVGTPILNKMKTVIIHSCDLDLFIQIS